MDVRSPEFDWRAAYKLLIGLVCPRPIALVSTISPDGRHNLAPFSFYNMVCGNPPVVMFCPALNRHRQEKHSYVNVEATREFVVAVVDDSIADAMVRCAAELPYGQSEFDFSGLTPAPARHVRPPLVREAPANIECTLRQIVSMGDQPSASRVVFGDVVAVHVRDDLLRPGGEFVDPHKLRAVGRMGESYYSTVTQPWTREVPKV